MAHSEFKPDGSKGAEAEQRSQQVLGNNDGVSIPVVQGVQDNVAEVQLTTVQSNHQPVQIQHEDEEFVDRQLGVPLSDSVTSQSVRESESAVPSSVERSGSGQDSFLSLGNAPIASNVSDESSATCSDQNNTNVLALVSEPRKVSRFIVDDVPGPDNDQPNDQPSEKTVSNQRVQEREVKTEQKFDNGEEPHVIESESETKRETTVLKQLALLPTTLTHSTEIQQTVGHSSHLESKSQPLEEQPASLQPEKEKLKLKHGTDREHVEGDLNEPRSPRSPGVPIDQQSSIVSVHQHGGPSIGAVSNPMEYVKMQTVGQSTQSVETSGSIVTADSSEPAGSGSGHSSRQHSISGLPDSESDKLRQLYFHTSGSNTPGMSDTEDDEQRSLPARTELLETFYKLKQEEEDLTTTLGPLKARVEGLQKRLETVQSQLKTVKSDLNPDDMQGKRLKSGDDLSRGVPKPNEESSRGLHLVVQSRSQTRILDPVGESKKPEPMQREQRPQGLEQRPQGLEQRPQGLEQRPQGLEQRPQGLEQRPQGLEQRPQGLEQRPQGLEQRPQGLEQRPQGLEQRPQGLEQRPQGLEQRPQGLEQRPQGLEQRPQGLEQRPQGLEQRPQGLEQRQVKLKESEKRRASELPSSKPQAGVPPATSVQSIPSKPSTDKKQTVNHRKEQRGEDRKTVESRPVQRPSATVQGYPPPKSQSQSQLKTGQQKPQAGQQKQPPLVPQIPTQSMPQKQTRAPMQQQQKQTQPKQTQSVSQMHLQSVPPHQKSVSNFVPPPQQQQQQQHHPVLSHGSVYLQNQVEWTEFTGDPRVTPQQSIGFVPTSQSNQALPSSQSAQILQPQHVLKPDLQKSTLDEFDPLSQGKHLADDPSQN